MAGTEKNKEKYKPFEVNPLLNDELNKIKFENKTFFEKLWLLKSNITVEPILAGLIIPSMLSRLAIQNLNLEKACRVKLNYSEDICNSLVQKNGTNLNDYEREVQKIIAAIEAWKSVIQTTLPTILVLFMGAWSDKTGNRKICILLPIFSEFITCISNILSTYFFYEIPVEVTMVLEGLFVAASGGWVMVFLGVFSYISDVTTDETRTFRIGLANLCMTAGVPIGTALSGVLLTYLGYYGIFLICGTIYLVTFLYGLFSLKTISKPPDPSNKINKFHFSEVLRLVKQTVHVAFKKRPGKTRMKIILTLLTVAIIYGPNHGERLIIYLYVRYQLKWNAVRYSIYSTYNIITHSIGALFSISVFSRRWGFPDALLCLISITSKFAGSILLAFVKTDFQMFMVPLVEILNATTFTSLRSLASKLVSSEELGKMNSLFSLVETIGAFMFDPTYSAMYMTTIKQMPGAVFLFSAAMTIPPGCALVWLLIQVKKEKRQKKETDKDEENVKNNDDLKMENFKDKYLKE